MHGTRPRANVPDLNVGRRHLMADGTGRQGIKGKTKGMTGELAPVLWAEGRREEVLRYVAQDVRCTLELATACEALGSLRWVARSGKVRSVALPKGWLSVSEALRLPLPDTSWMDEPWPRGRFRGWMG
jgi:hypothetical protein